MGALYFGAPADGSIWRNHEEYEEESQLGHSRLARVGRLVQADRAERLTSCYLGQTRSFLWHKSHAARTVPGTLPRRITA